MQDNKYIVLKYLRLSLEDGDSVESDSISNQRDLLDLHIAVTFAGKDVEVMELVDDGYSGTNMNRPGMKRLLVLAEMNLIQCIIVKDFSRFARDYIEVGRYTDKIFPEWRTRFISVNDNYDSMDYLGLTPGVDVAIKNLSNAMYSQDLSEKIKSVKRLQQKRGETYAYFAIYGYMKSPEDKHKFIVDPEAAEVVKRIFKMKDEGFSYTQIAKILNDEGVLSPSEYKNKKFPKLNKDWTGVNRRAYWNRSTLAAIISDERYIGNMVLGKTRVPYVGAKPVRVEPKDYVIVENTHEAIIDRDVFLRVRPKRYKRTTETPKVLLAGLIRCAGCNRVMLKYGKYPDAIKYRCPSLNVGIDMNCCHDTFKEQELNEIVIKAVKNEIIKTAELVQVRNSMREKEKTYSKTINTISKRIKGLKQQKIDGYIRLTKKEISEDDFLQIKKKIESSIADCEKELDSYKVAGVSEADELTINLFEEYLNAETFTNEMLKCLIKTIYIYDDRRIEIKWNYKEKVV